jgi:hypothetical protein
MDMSLVSGGGMNMNTKEIDTVSRHTTHYARLNRLSNYDRIVLDNDIRTPRYLRGFVGDQ